MTNETYTSAHFGPAMRLICYENGAIKTPSGKLIAFYDRAAQVLHIDGITTPFYGVADETDTYDIIHANYKGAMQ